MKNSLYWQRRTKIPCCKYTVNNNNQATFALCPSCMSMWCGNKVSRNTRVEKYQKDDFQSRTRQNIIFNRMEIDFLMEMFCMLNGILEEADRNIF